MAPYFGALNIFSNVSTAVSQWADCPWRSTPSRILLKPSSRILISSSGSPNRIFRAEALIKSVWMAVALSMRALSTPQAAAAAIAAVPSLMMRNNVVRSERRCHPKEQLRLRR